MGRRKKEEMNKEKPQVHKDLEGLDIKINPLGEIETSISIDEVNEFLNKNVEDIKLKDRKDLKTKKKKSNPKKSKG